jgi:tetratricopeptide (TPR) repeat protein
MDNKRKPPPLKQPALWPALGRKSHWAAILGLGIVTLLAFSNTLQNTGFALDNKFIIIEDPRLRATNWDNLRQIFTEDYWYPKAVSGLYRPLTTLSYLFNYAVLGSRDNSTSYHVVNFLLHWANAVLVYFLALVLMQKPWRAALTGAVFAVHPIVTESVSNIVGRADLFATAAVLGAFLCYAKSTTERGWVRAGWLALAGVITLLGVFCKESAIVVIGVVGLYDITYRLQRRHPNWFVNLWENFWRLFWNGYVAFVPGLFAMSIVRKIVFERLRPPEQPFVDNPLVGADFWTARLTAIKVIGKYFGLLLWPKTLSCDYSYNQVPLVTWTLRTWEDISAWLSLAAIVVVFVVAIRNYHRHKAVFFFVLFFFGTLLPSSNLIPNPTFGMSLLDKEAWCIGSIMAERFLYLPFIGFAGCAVIAVYALSRRLFPPPAGAGEDSPGRWQPVARGVIVVIVVACGVRTWFRNWDWENDVALWEQAAKACPNSFKTHKSLAYALYEELNKLSPSDPRYDPLLDRIIEEAEKALRVTDRTQIVFLHLGAYYRMKGDRVARPNPDGTLVATAESIEWYQKSADTLAGAVPLDRAFNDDNRQKELRRGRNPEDIPDIGNHEIYWNLGISYMRLGRYQDAYNAFLYMRHLAPTNVDAYLSIADVLLRTGHTEEGAIALVQALLIDSNRQDALHLLVNIYNQTDKGGCAVAQAPGSPQPMLNRDCPLVLRHICAAYAGLTQVFAEAKQWTLARQTRNGALKTYGCAREPFDRALTKQPSNPIPTP